MNVLDAIVTKVIGEPYEKFGRWWVDVEYDCYGQMDETSLMCQSQGDALSVNVGYEFHV